jgi:hypothetical protein
MSRDSIIDQRRRLKGQTAHTIRSIAAFNERKYLILIREIAQSAVCITKRPATPDGVEFPVWRRADFDQLVHRDHRAEVDQARQFRTRKR